MGVKRFMVLPPEQRTPDVIGMSPMWFGRESPSGMG